MALMRLAPFVIIEKGNPEQMMQEFPEYINIFGMFLQARGIDGNLMENWTNCGAYQEAKASLQLFGGKEIMRLLRRLGRQKKETPTRQQ